MNRDGQLHKLLSLEFHHAATNFISVAFGDGMPASAKWVREGILAKYTNGSKPMAAKSNKKYPPKKTVSAKNGGKGAK